MEVYDDDDDNNNNNNHNNNDDNDNNNYYYNYNKGKWSETLTAGDILRIEIR